jgi:hypothetical protein
MKKIELKKLLYLAGVLLLAMTVMVSCSDDDDDDPILVEDGMYITGAVTPFDGLNFKGMFMIGINEADDQTPRTGMYEIYMALEAGAAGFSITEKAGATETTYGPATVETINTEGADEQPNITIQKGTLGTSGVFTVPANGLYHIIVDKPTNTFVIAPVPYYAILGGVTDLGWSDTQMPLVGGFNQTSMKFEVTDLVLRGGNFKFRYGGGWKLEIHMDDQLELKANTNFGGEVQGTLPDLTTTLERGGADYVFSGDFEGLYDVAITWSLEDGFSSSLTKTADVEPLPYPDNLYMIGDGVGNWVWAETDLPMVGVHSKPHLFWKIVWMNATGEFKFAPVKDWGSDFGRSGAASNGIYAIGGDNVPVPGTAGYYMVVVNLETEQIAVVDPKVYLIGNAIGNWDTANPAGLFTVDNANEVITITKALAATPELRMYAWFDAAEGWFTDWWQSEFIVIDGELLMRGRGDDQARVAVTANTYKIDLNFKNKTGSITQQ